MKLEVQIKKKLGKFNLHAAFEICDEKFAILGASGCGKSMTLKCIAGIETPDEGRIVLNNRVLYDSEKKINLPPQKRRIGYLFPDYALFPNMTVEQNIMAGMGRKPDKALVREYISRFCLDDVGKNYPTQLSSGQKQRTAVARMLAANPEVILLDEPFSALDSYLRWQLEQQLTQILAEEKKPVIFVSHNRDEVYRMCDTVCCISDGAVECIQPVKDFFQSPKTKTAAILSGCKNISEARVTDRHYIEALDWGMKLFCPEIEIPEDTTGIGIRAHSFYPVENPVGCVNYFPIKEFCIVEDLFEWTISFRPNEQSSRLQWKIAKSDWNPTQMPGGVAVDARNLLFFGSNCI